MAFRVDIAPSALQDAEDAYLWIKAHAPSTAGDWYEGLLEAIFSLENFPLRCPLAPESQDIGKEIRQLLYGKRRRSYRILFGLSRDETTGDEVVRIYRIRHHAQRRATAGDIEAGAEQEET